MKRKLRILLERINVQPRRTTILLNVGNVEQHLLRSNRRLQTRQRNNRSPRNRPTKARQWRRHRAGRPRSPHHAGHQPAKDDRPRRAPHRFRPKALVSSSVERSNHASPPATPRRSVGAYSTTALHRSRSMSKPLHSRTLASSAFVFELGGKQVNRHEEDQGAESSFFRTIERLGECRHGARKPRDHHVVAAMHTQSARGLRRSNRPACREPGSRTSSSRPTNAIAARIEPLHGSSERSQRRGT